MRYLERHGVALIVVAALLGVLLAAALYQWETNTRAALALANPSPTPTVAPPALTPTITLSNQPAGIPTQPATDTPEPTATSQPSPTAAAGTPSPSAAGTPSPVAVSTPTATAAPAVTPSPTPAGDPVVGARVFAGTCSSCHPNANAGVGPALHGAQFSALFPDDSALKAFIRQGHGVMPAFPPSKLSDTNLDNIVAYLRSLK